MTGESVLDLLPMCVHRDCATRNMSSVRIRLICVGGSKWRDGNGVLWWKGEGSEEVAGQSVDRGFSQNSDSFRQIKVSRH
jgi:hypothetical protein